MVCIADELHLYVKRENMKMLWNLQVDILVNCSTQILLIFTVLSTVESAVFSMTVL